MIASGIRRADQSRVLQRSCKDAQRLEQLHRKVSIVVAAIWTTVAVASVGVGALLGVAAGLLTTVLLSVLAWKMQTSEEQKIFVRKVRKTKKLPATSRNLEQSSFVHVSEEVSKTAAILQEVQETIQKLRASRHVAPSDDTSSLESCAGGSHDVLAQLKETFQEMRKSEFAPIRLKPLECRERCRKFAEERYTIYFWARAIADGKDYLSTNGEACFNIGDSSVFPEKATQFSPCDVPFGKKALRIWISPHHLEPMLDGYFAQMVGEAPLVWVPGNLKAFVSNVKQFELKGLLETFYLRSTLSVMEEDIEKLGPIPEGGGTYLPIKVFLRSEEWGYATCPPYKMGFFVTPEKEEKNLHKDVQAFEEAVKRLLRFAFTKKIRKIVISFQHWNYEVKDHVLSGALTNIIRQQEFQFSPEIYLLLSKGQWNRLKGEKLFNPFYEEKFLTAGEFSFDSDPLNPLTSRVCKQTSDSLALR